VSDQPALRCEVTVRGAVPDAVLGALRQRFEHVSLTCDRTCLRVGVLDQSAIRGLVTFLWDLGLEVQSMNSGVELT